MKAASILAVAVVCLSPAMVHAQKDERTRDLIDRLSSDRRVLPLIVKQGSAAVPDLVEMVKNSKGEHQSLLVYALAEIARDVGPKASAAVPALCEALRSKDKAVASEAARGLGYIGASATPELVKIIKTAQNPADVVLVIRALGRIGPGAREASPAILQVLRQTKDVHLRVACIDALGGVGPAGKGTADVLVQMSKDNPKAIYAANIVIALGKLGPDAEAAVPYLFGIIKDAPEGHLKIHAMESLARVSPKSKEASQAVASLLDSQHVPKILVLESLSLAGPLSKEMVKAVEESMRDRDPSVRLHAAMIVGKVNANHPAVVSILIESLREKDATLRRKAAETIGAIRPTDEAVVEALATRLMDPDPLVRTAVMAALEKFKKK